MNGDSVESRTNPSRRSPSRAAASIPLKDTDALALVKLQFGESQERRLARVRVPFVRHFTPPNQPGPHLIHCICVSQWSAGNLPANEQTHHHEPPEEFARTRIDAETLQLRKGANQLVYLRVAKWRHYILRDTGGEELADGVENNLRGFDGCHGDHFDAACFGGGGPNSEMHPACFR